MSIGEESREEGREKRNGRGGMVSRGGNYSLDEGKVVG